MAVGDRDYCKVYAVIYGELRIYLSAVTDALSRVISDIEVLLGDHEALDIIGMILVEMGDDDFFIGRILYGFI